MSKVAKIALLVAVILAIVQIFIGFRMAGDETQLMTSHVSLAFLITGLAALAIVTARGYTIMRIVVLVAIVLLALQISVGFGLMMGAMSEAMETIHTLLAIAITVTLAGGAVLGQKQPFIKS